MGWYQFSVSAKYAAKAYWVVQGQTLAADQKGQPFMFYGFKHTEEAVDVATKLVNAQIPFQYEGGGTS